MKNLKKLNRKQLQTLHGAGSLTCIGCPKNTTYGNNPGDASCEAFNMLPDRCKMCVIVDMSCMSGGVS